MRQLVSASVLSIALAFVAGPVAFAGQAPSSAAAPDIPVSHRDRVYAAEQFSNTVSVIDPAANKLLGIIRLGDPLPGNLSPLYIGQLLVHGMGFSPDHRTIAVVAIGSNAVNFIDTATNEVKHVTYVGRSPHEAFFTPDGSEVWVTVRGENYVSVLDGTTYVEKTRITVPNGPGMTIFSPDGKYGYVCSSFTPETVVVDVATHAVVGRVPQASPFCPNIAATPDGTQVWFTLKDTGKTQVFEARPPFSLLKTIDTGPISNHVNFAHNANGTFAYVTIGGLNVVKVFRTSDFAQVATIPVGNLPHGVWPSGDGTRVYVGLENADRMAAIDTLTNRVVANIPIGQGAQAIVYVPDAVPDGTGTQGLKPLGLAGEAAHLTLVPVQSGVAGAGKPPTSVSLFDQGLVQVLEAAVTGLEPRTRYVLALSRRADGHGVLEPLSGFVTNPAGAAIVNAVGPIRQLISAEDRLQRRYLVIVSGTAAQLGTLEQIQAPATSPAAQLFAAGQFDAAAAAYERVLAAHPGDPGASLGLGAIRLYENDLAAAEPLLRAASSAQPSSPRAGALLRELQRRRAEAARMSQVANGETTVPFVYAEPLPVVRAEVNGVPVELIVDTGGTLDLDPSVVARLGIPTQEAGSGIFAGGMRAPIRNGVLHKLALGGATAFDVPINVLPAHGSELFAGAHIDGVVGTTVFERFLVTIDYPKARLVLRPRSAEVSARFESEAKAAGATIVPCWLVGDHFVFADARVDAAPDGLFLFDSGLAGGGLMATRALIDAAGITLDEAHAGTGLGGGGAVQVVPFVARRIAVGQAQQSDVPGSFTPQGSPLSIFPFTVWGAISHDFLKHYAYTVDFDAMRVVLE